MATVQIGGAGGAPSNNVIRSLRESGRKDRIIGTSCLPSDLFLADVDESHVLPMATDASYDKALLSLLKRVRPDFLHVQHDYEVRAVSRLRDEIHDLGVRLYLPSRQAVESCVDKYETYRIWEAAGLRVPTTVFLSEPGDLEVAAGSCGLPLWVRATTGGGGRGSLPTADLVFARMWVDRHSGWGAFTASTYLSETSVTWTSLWYEGELVVAQSRRRRSWNFGDRTLSGVTGVTGVGVTCSDPVVDQTAQDSIFAVDPSPHGIFSVDMTYDQAGFPNPTEINIGRFFTTIYFFTTAGLNVPAIYRDLVIDQAFPKLDRKINPLPPGLAWIRGMDVTPVLVAVEDIEKMEAQLLEVRGGGQ